MGVLLCGLVSLLDAAPPSTAPPPPTAREADADPAAIAARIAALRHTLLPGLAGRKWSRLESLLAEAEKAEKSDDPRAAVHAWSRVRLFLRSLEGEHEWRTSPNGDLQLGKVTLHRADHCLSIPARYRPNPDMPVEVICCREGAERAYETLFTTPARPLHLQTMLILLGATNGPRSGKNDGQARGDLFDLRIETPARNGTDKQRWSVAAFLSSDSDTPLSQAAWIFTGSTVHEGCFTADQSGELILGWDTGAAVLVSDVEDIAAGQTALFNAPNAPLPPGAEVTLYLIPRHLPEKPGKKEPPDP